VLEKLDSLDDSGNGVDYFVKALHSVGRPVDGQVEQPHWPCDPDRTIILHKSVYRLPIIII